MLERLRLVGLCGLMALASGPQAGTGGDMPHVPRVFGATVGHADVLKRDDRATIQSRLVRPDLDAIRALARAHRAGGASTGFVLDLFDATQVDAEVVDSEFRSGGLTLFARAKNVAHGGAVLTIEDGVLVGSVDLPRESFTIDRQPDGTYRVARKAASLPPRELPPRRKASSSFARGMDLGLPQASSGPGRRIDVMIVWTPTAAWAVESAGGTIASIAQAAVDSANAVYRNSGVANRLRLVNAQQVSYSERSDCADGEAFYCAIDDLTGTSDGYIDDVHALRDAHGADLVSLFIASPGNACGVGWEPLPPSATTDDQAFSVLNVLYDCPVGNKSFVHELGHNHGADHDPVNAYPAPASFPYNRGFHAPDGQWRTVMAYGGGCNFCPRLPYFSNPRLDNSGIALGMAPTWDARGTVISAGADNTLVHNKYGPVIAGYRRAVHADPQRFGDVPASHPFARAIEFLGQAGITAGCGSGDYCPEGRVTRRQMAAFLERAKRAADWVPPAPTGMVFADVPSDGEFAGQIEALYRDGVTQGCSASPQRYCPDDSVTRAHAAVLLLRARCGATYAPDAPAAATFEDVPPGHPQYRFVEKLASLGITHGCSVAPRRFCPDEAVLRSHMAALIERAFPFVTPSEVCVP